MFSKEILLSLHKPARYINQELNTYHRDLKEVKLTFCLAYPDIYEVGMSNLGFRIIYDLINQDQEVLCERTFLPWSDLEDYMRKNNVPLFSLESNIPLYNFDILGISIQTEFNYTGILNLLNLGKIPILSIERNKNYPLVIAGGSSCFNPEPLADFIDLFVIGEGEEIILEIIKICKNRKKQIKDREGRQELLIELAHLEGVYVPKLYSVDYENYGKIKRFYALDSALPQRIKKRIVSDLDNAYFPTKTVVPYIKIIHDRIGIEIMRGCPHNCRFCQARTIYYPKRERSIEKIIELANKNFLSSGYEEIALLSLSSLDHSEIKKIFPTLTQFFKNKGVSISLSSLRVNQVMMDLLKEFQGMRRVGLTFAPEAGSERLRKIINKNIDIELLFKIAEEIFKFGWRGLKLYFMIGLPEENYKDIEEIVKIVYEILAIMKKRNGTGTIRLSFNSFIPKPHTPFQWLPMENTDILKEKINYLKDKLRNKMIKYHFSPLQEDWLEALLSRGDRKLCKVILKAWEKGARLDGWREQFNFLAWEEAVKETGINPDFYIYRKRELKEILPWDFIDVGIEKEKFVIDYQNFEKLS